MKERTLRNVNSRKRTKFIHEGMYVAEVEVELTEDGCGWSPCLSLDDAYKLDDVREALRSGNLGAARQNGRIHGHDQVKEEKLPEHRHGDAPDTHFFEL